MFTVNSTLPKATKTTHLTPEHEETIKATLPVIGAHINEITPVFYKRMFAAHPELIADTFNRGNQKAGEQQKALAASIATFASMLVNPDAPDPVHLLSRIAHKHVSLGIIASQYQIVHDNLFAAIVDVLGEAVTPEVAEAWDEVYWLMAKVLIDEESALYESDGVAAGDVFRRAVLRSRRDLTDAVTEFTFEVPEDKGAFLKTRPGQYTSIGLKLEDGARQLRQYSLVDWDENGFTISVQRDGEVSTALIDSISVGDVVDCTLPAGDLTLDLGETAPVVLVSSGIGSTPMVGMLTAMAADSAQRDVTIIHSDRNAGSYAQATVVDELVAALTSKGSTVRVYRNFLDEGTLVDLATLDIPQGARWYLCGGSTFLQSIREQIKTNKQLQPKDVHFELFSPNDWLLD